MKRFILMVTMMLMPAAAVFAASNTKTAFVKNSTGDTIALVEQNDDNTYDWSTIVVVHKDCIAIKHSEKRISILIGFDESTGKVKGGYWTNFDTKGILFEITVNDKGVPCGKEASLTK